MLAEDTIGRIGLILGILLFFIVLYSPLELDFPAKLVLATTLLMSTFWITEALPIYVTALLPLIIFPFANSDELSNTLTKYADRIIFLFLGGFIIALSIEKSMLHKRFALNILKTFGTNPKHIIGAFMIATASLSAWISNTATTMLMLPIALAIIAQINSNEKKRFAICLLLAIAYSASLGGLATLIGTPPNAILASLSKQLLDIEISFGKWLLIGVPLSIISLIITWFYLVNIGVKISKKPILGEKSIILAELKKLGAMKRDEKIVSIVFGITALAWITRGLVWKDYLPFVDDSMIALLSALSLFIIPSKEGRVLVWSDTKRIPWGVLLLMGGGLTLASAFTTTGLDLWLSEYLSF
ncbi:MAG: DASS family sodium-coupled anion symporter, partial [Candidatus Nitrosothermus koennekii]